MRPSLTLKKAAWMLLLSTAVLLLAFTIQAQSLKTVPTPPVTNKAAFIKDANKAAQLGKAFFWDMQVGGDGFTACATCHFHAGADSRNKNQLNPRVGGFEQGANGAPFGQNFPLVLANFPFPLATNDVSGSQGVRSAVFLDIDLVGGVANAVDKSVAPPSGNRQTTGRNTPSAINAIFNFRNFWDTRAQNDFNGRNPFGRRDTGATVLRGDGTLTGPVSPVPLTSATLSLSNCSPASQAVGPPNNSVEMSFAGRTFPKLGKKLLHLTPLGKQFVDQSDSLLGSLSNGPAFRGLTTSYSQMIEDAFQPQWWNSNKLFNADGTVNTDNPPPDPNTNTNVFTLKEFNMSLFWGLAVQEYVSTLRADDSPFDRFLDGNQSALNGPQQRGFDVFHQAQCDACHSNAELTSASVSQVSVNRVIRIETEGFASAIADNGIFSLGVRPESDDVGIGGTTPFPGPDNRLSDARRVQQGFFVDRTLKPGFNARKDAVADSGAFKTPGLRNVELTAPYMNTGSFGTLKQVVEFYNRGGDFHPPANNTHHSKVKPRGLTTGQIDDLVEFLKALTDERVRKHQAPFDHPQICVPNGHTSPGGPDDVRNIDAVGAGGYGSFPNFPDPIGSPAVSGNCLLP